MIAKVQISLFSNEEQCTVLIYDQERTIWHEGPVEPWLRALMGDRSKAFFHVTIGPGEPGQSDRIFFGEEASWQSW